MSKNKKKLGYSQYERLLAEAHQKLEILAQKTHELQTYFIAYVEFSGNNIQFNEWMNARIKAMKDEIEQKDTTEQHLNEGEIVNEEV